MSRLREPIYESPHFDFQPTLTPKQLQADQDRRFEDVSLTRIDKPEIQIGYRLRFEQYGKEEQGGQRWKA